MVWVESSAGFPTGPVGPRPRARDPGEGGGKIMREKKKEEKEWKCNDFALKMPQIPATSTDFPWTPTKGFVPWPKQDPWGSHASRTSNLTLRALNFSLAQGPGKGKFSTGGNLCHLVCGWGRVEIMFGKEVRGGMCRDCSYWALLIHRMF